MAGQLSIEYEVHCLGGTVAGYVSCASGVSGALFFILFFSLFFFGIGFASLCFAGLG